MIPLKLDEAQSSSNAFGFQKNSEFTDLFNYHIIKMEKNGIMRRFIDKLFSYWRNNSSDRIERKWKTKYNAEYGVEDAPSLGFDMVLWPFGLLVVGAITSPLILLLLEKPYKKCTEVLARSKEPSSTMSGESTNNFLDPPPYEENTYATTPKSWPWQR